MKRRKVVISAKQAADGARPRSKEKTRGEPPSRASRSEARLASEKGKSKISKQKRIARERRLAVRRRRAILIIVLSALALLLIAFGVFSIYQSDLFKITTVTVEGNDRLSDESVRVAASIPEEETLLRLSTPEIEERIKRDPWVSAATVSRRFPSTVVIDVEERVPVAMLDVGDSSFFLLDARGYILARQTPDETVTAVVIRDVGDVETTPGVRPRSEPLKNALEVWNGLSPQMREMVRAISAPSVGETALITEDGVEIFVGPSVDITRKEEIAREIMTEHAGSVVYINVRSIERPTWRALETF